MKCVGHFGSVRAGDTQSNCSLEGKCDRAFSFIHQTGLTSSPKQSKGESRGGGADGERKRRESRSRRESESEKREEMGARERYNAREGRGVRKRAGGYH